MENFNQPRQQQVSQFLKTSEMQKPGNDLTKTIRTKYIYSVVNGRRKTLVFEIRRREEKKKNILLKG